MNISAVTSTRTVKCSLPLMPWVNKNCKNSLRRSSTSTTSNSELLGTAPYYKRHLVLHSSLSSSLWPARIDHISPVYAALCALAEPKGPLEGVGIGYSDSGTSLLASDTKEEGKLTAWMYPEHVRLPIELTTDNLDAFQRVFREAIERPVVPSPRSTHIYVCTHGSRGRSIPPTSRTEG